MRQLTLTSCLNPSFGGAGEGFYNTIKFPDEYAVQVRSCILFTKMDE